MCQNCIELHTYTHTNCAYITDEVGIICMDCANVIFLAVILSCSCVGYWHWMFRRDTWDFPVHFFVTSYESIITSN